MCTVVGLSDTFLVINNRRRTFRDRLMCRVWSRWKVEVRKGKSGAIHVSRGDAVTWRVRVVSAWRHLRRGTAVCE